MNVILDPPLNVGPLRIATISQKTRSWREIHGGAVLAGGKRPLALLVELNGRVSAHAANGERLDLAEIEAMCPGALAAFAAAR